MARERLAHLIRGLDAQMSRRGLAGLAAGALATFGLTTASDAKKKKKKKKKPTTTPPASCTPNCSGKTCGSNGCGGSCGSCSNTQTCNAQQQCVALEVYELKATFGEEGDHLGAFDDPRGVVVDSSGNIWVSDNGNERVQKLDSTGDYIDDFWRIDQITTIDRPDGLAIDSNNNIYIVDTAVGWVVKIKGSDLSLITTIGEFGGDPDEFRKPVAVAVDGTDIYVTDAQQHRVAKFRQNVSDPLVYDHVLNWGSEGTSDSQFDNPRGIAVDSEHNIYVVDGRNARVQKFSNTGTFITKWGTSGSDREQFDGAGAIAVDADDNVYVADFERVQKFTKTGGFITEWRGGSGDDRLIGPSGIFVTSNGVVFVADGTWHRVQKYEKVGGAPRSAQADKSDKSGHTEKDSKSGKSRRSGKSGKHRKARRNRH